jgi:sugar lactone lactonase YvrE
MKVACIVESRNQVGEGPLWNPEEGRIYWTDINGFRIQRFTPHTGKLEIWRFSEPVCAMSLTSAPGWILVALGSRVILWSSTTDECLDFARPEPNFPYNRLNDGATDPNGIYWIGSMRNNVASDGGSIAVTGNSGSLYRITGDGEVSVWDTGYGISNTLVWSPDLKTFYCACSLRNVIYAYDYDVSDSSVRNRRAFAANLDHGVPDGSAMDAEGYLWNCRFYGKCILRISPNGRIDKIIEMPVSNVTHCAFGGPDLTTLYITSASIGAPSGERLAGSLFAIHTEVPGMPTGRFRISEEAISRLSIRTKHHVPRPVVRSQDTASPMSGRDNKA